MKTIKVYHIPVLKAHLKAMPNEERSFLLRLGSSANQLSMLQKLLIFSSNAEPTEINERMLSAAQTQMLLRLTIGALHESWALIDKGFLKLPMGRVYQGLLDAEGLAALNFLKGAVGKSNLIPLIRNKISYHLDDEVLDRAFEGACNDPNSDELWTLYFSQYGFNSFYMMSDLMLVHGISHLANDPDIGALQVTLMKDVRANIEAHFEFSKAFFAACWVKNFGKEIMAKELLEFPNPPHIDAVSIPFFIEM